MTVRSAPLRRWLALLPLAGAVGFAVWWSATPTAGAQELPPAPEVSAPPEGVVLTPYGPLAETDREFLVRVRLAGLWEVPAGQMAAEKGTTEQIREIGEWIRDEHLELDEAVRDAAAKLGVELPNEPSAEHQLLLDEMAAAEGEQFDRLFIQYLREAHGVIYPIIAYVRAGTQNELMREFAEVGEEFVGNHLNYLESSGLVDWNHIKPAPEPLGTQSRFLAAEPAGVHPIAIYVLLGAAAVGGGIQMIRTLRPQ